MKKIVAVSAVLLALFACAGCVTMHSDTVIEKDGSGTAAMEFGMSTSVAEALREMQAMDTSGQSDMELPAFDDIDKAEIEKAVKPFDVKLTGFEKSDADGRQLVKMTFAFKDLKGLSAAMTVAMGGGGEDAGEGLGIYEAGDGNLVLRQAQYDFSDLEIPTREEDADAAAEETEAPAQPSPEDMQKQMELMGKLMGAMSEMDVRIAITVPGDIVETNAPEQEGRTSIWTINAENMMSQGGDLNPVITFAGKGLKITPLTE
jgi:hypothetical protein